MKKNLLLFFTCLLATASLFAQDDLDDLLDDMEETEAKVEYVTAAFKSSRVINMHSVEKVGPGALEFRISHRFGEIKDGWRELFGIDNASVRFGLDYGINDYIMIGIGRSTYQKIYDAYTKVSILRQSTGKRKMPISLLYFGSIGVQSTEWANEDRDNQFKHRISYVHQLIIGRKFSPGFSFQLVPSVVHHNLVTYTADANTIPALGAGTRIKISKRVAINAEYFWRFPVKDNAPNLDGFKDSFSIGVDIETGGHVFQLQFTNSRAMVEKGFITETNADWFDGGILFGFNITREFTIVRPKHK